MKNNIPQANRTCFCSNTSIHPPNCPTKLIRTNKVARIIPQFQDMSMYLLCSDHWKYIRRPSSIKVDIKHNRDAVGKYALQFLTTC